MEEKVFLNAVFLKTLCMLLSMLMCTFIRSPGSCSSPSIDLTTPDMDLDKHKTLCRLLWSPHFVTVELVVIQCILIQAISWLFTKPEVLYLHYSTRCHFYLLNQIILTATHALSIQNILRMFHHKALYS